MWMRRGVLAASTSDVLRRTADTGGERLQRSTQPQFVALLPQQPTDVEFDCAAGRARLTST